MPRASLREQLLAAGLEALHRRGFNATSIQDITDAADAPKGSFYNHFESKEALALEALRLYVERGKFRRAVLQDATLPPLRRLRDYFESINHAAIDSHFASGCLLGNFSAELSGQSPLIRRWVDGAFTAWRDAVASVIGEAQKAGEISRKSSPRALADFTIAAWEGAVLRAKAAKNRAPLDLFYDITFKKILA
jgi:TetR/AcrR family transcriptional repressor of nem operon